MSWLLDAIAKLDNLLRPPRRGEPSTPALIHYHRSADHRPQRDAERRTGGRRP